MKIHSLLLAGFVLTSLHAEPVFEDNFNTVPDPAGLTKWRGTKDRVSESDGAWLEVVADEKNVFGEGAENRVLVVRDQSEGEQVNLYAKLKGTEDVVTVSFDFVEPDEVSVGPVILRIGTAGNEPSELAVELTLRDGKLDPLPDELYSVGEKHRVTVVVNNSPASVSYDGMTLPSQHYDVFIDGRIALPAAAFTTRDATLPAGASIDALRLLTYTSVTKDQAVFLDNVTIANGAQKP
jgi:hypothetical protein